MKKKQIIAILMAIVMLIGVAACGDSGNETADDSQEDAAVDTVDDADTDEDVDADTDTDEDAEAGEDTEAGGDWTIAVVPKDEANPWFVRMKEGVNQYAADTGLDVFQRGPAETDAQQQIQVVEDLIAQGVDALCVVPHDPGAMEPVLQKAMDAGIVVITHEAASQVNCDYNLEAFNYDEYGAFIMDTLAEAMGEEGKYITMVGSFTNDSHNMEADSAIEHQKANYPNMELIEEDFKVESEDNPEVAYQKAKEIIKKHPDLKGVVGTSSFDSPGVGRAIEELGLIGQVFTAGTGMPQTNKALLESGAVHALTLWDPADAGYAMCELARMVLDGEEVGEGTDLGVDGYNNLELDGKVLTGQAWITITKENVDDFNF
ncbi:MAG: autoinducer 2 ABC transporter substrate-binding protein [Clostridiaceae bacterium]|nr:autoinducer 2 ABC transporter substrate-binding protein [Clostridiaceae bacterium]